MKTKFCNPSCAQHYSMNISVNIYIYLEDSLTTCSFVQTTITCSPLDPYAYTITCFQNWTCSTRHKFSPMSRPQLRSNKGWLFPKSHAVSALEAISCLIGQYHSTCIHSLIRQLITSPLSSLYTHSTSLKASHESRCVQHNFNWISLFSATKVCLHQ